MDSPVRINRVDKSYKARTCKHSFGCMSSVEHVDRAGVYVCLRCDRCGTGVIIPLRVKNDGNGGVDVKIENPPGTETNIKEE